MISVYCLKLENNKYYVGKTNNINFRITDHFDGNGSEWTKKYKPVDIVAIKHKCDNFDEDKYTKMAMLKYGIENVRGGSYTQLVLPKNVKDLLTKELQSTNNSCFKCGEKGHYANECGQFSNTSYSTTSKINNMTCFKCGKKGHYANGCNQSTSIDYYTLHGPNSNNLTCFNCGKIGHYSNKCFAKKQYEFCSDNYSDFEFDSD